MKIVEKVFIFACLIFIIQAQSDSYNNQEAVTDQGYVVFHGKTIPIGITPKRLSLRANRDQLPESELNVLEKEERIKLK